MKISITAIIGILLGLGIFTLAVVFNTDNYIVFFSLSGLAMVIGGTLAAAMISYEGRQVMLAFKDILQTLMTAKVDTRKLYEDVGVLIDWSMVIRREGLVRLENVVEIDDADKSFLNRSFIYLLSGYQGPKLRLLLQHSKQSLYERNMFQARVLMTMASAAPAFGMVGTLVGLVIMLNSMQGNPAEIGSGMAVALLTTLYGVLLAQLILKPAARKVEQNQDLEAYRNQVLTEGLVLLSEGASPILIEDAMNAYLDGDYQFKRAKKQQDGHEKASI